MSRTGLRVLHLLPHLRQSGNGYVNSTVDLALEQAASGLTVSVASRAGSYVPLLAAAGVTHHELRLEFRPRYSVPATVRRLRAVIRAVRPDVVHPHNPAETVLARAAVLGTRVPVVATAHTQFSRSTFALRVADKIIALSDANGAAMSEWAGDRVVVVKSGIVGSHLPVGDVVDLDRPAVLFVGGLNARKGVDDLISAFVDVAEQVPEATLYLVGNGPNRAELEQFAVDAGISERARFLGFQPNPRGYMRAADVLVLPSRREPFPRVLAEARESGCAIVATDVDGNPEILEHGAAGVLVPCGDVGALAEAIVRLLTKESEREQLAESARQNLGWLSVERSARETLAVYESALARKR